MKIHVKGYYSLQNVMDGESHLEVEKETATLREVLDDLSARFGKDLSELTDDSASREPASPVILLVNGRSYLSMPEKLDTELKDGDEVALFPPLVGG